MLAGSGWQAMVTLPGHPKMHCLESRAEVFKDLILVIGQMAASSVCQSLWLECSGNPNCKQTEMTFEPDLHQRGPLRAHNLGIWRSLPKEKPTEP